MFNDLELTLPIAVVRELVAVFDYNVGMRDRIDRVRESLSAHQRYFATICNAYSAKQGFPTLPRVLEIVGLKGKSVIEFGPSDGQHTAFLIASGACHVTLVEGRPENIVKLLAAQYAFGWNNLEIVCDNFQVPGRWASRRYDVVSAHGVFYHCINPFRFFDQLTRVSDMIFIMRRVRWAATLADPPSICVRTLRCAS
jgi:hypothetical protein